MDVMQATSSHVDARWRSHMLAYGPHLALPPLHDTLRPQLPDPCPDLPLHDTFHQDTQSNTIDHHTLPPLRPQLQRHQQQPQPQQQPQQRRQQQQQQQQQQQHIGAVGEVSSRVTAHTSLQLGVSPVQSCRPLGSPSTPTPPTPSPGKSGKDGEEKKDGGEWEQYNAGAAFLGPTLWDKTISYDSDLKVSLEYMDLDEFLNENGIPLEDKRAGSGKGVAGHQASPPLSTNAARLVPVLSPETPSSPESPRRLTPGLGLAPTQPTTPVGLGAAPLSVLPPAISPQECDGDGYPSSPDSSSNDSHDPLDPLQVHEPEAARASQGHNLLHTNEGLSGGRIQIGKGAITKVIIDTGACGLAKSEEVSASVSVNYEISPNDLALATVPGQDFDPRTRFFTEDELKPQPMVKKSRKQFVPNDMKDDKYWARRRKNNMAAKRSRDARRLKENQIAMRANFLEKEKLALKMELEKTVKEVEILKTRLEKYEEI